MKLQLWATLALLFSGSVTAQQAPHVCGAGPGPNEVQAGVQPGGGGMAPTPLCYWKSQQAPSQPTGYWEKTWGAIATSETGGALGIAVGMSNKAQAEQFAMADCQAKKGGGCRVDLAYYNQCSAMVVGTSFLVLYSAGSIEKAASRGLQDCQKKDSGCRVYYSACTEPIFHKY